MVKLFVPLTIVQLLLNLEYQNRISPESSKFDIQIGQNELGWIDWSKTAQARPPSLTFQLVFTSRPKESSI